MSRFSAFSISHAPPRGNVVLACHGVDLGGSEPAPIGQAGGMLRVPLYRVRKAKSRLSRFVAMAALLSVLAHAAALAADLTPPSDTLQQRVRPCIACHRADGIDLQAGYVPRLHGKPAGYLFNQLVNYREGRRHHGPMEHMVSNLSDEYLWEMAQYFAQGEAPHPPPAAAPAERVQARGRELAMHGDPARGIPACQACHGQRLTGVEPNTPGLLGLPNHYLAAQLGAWRVGRRQAAEPDCMHEIATRLSAEDIQAVSRWIAAQPVPQNAAPEAEPISEPPMGCGSVPLPGQ